MHGEHRLPSEKVWPYDESARVPLVMRGPDVPEGLALGQLTGNIDVVPTILDATGATPGRTQDGRSLFPLMEDPTLEWGREIVLESGFGANGVGGYRALRNYRYLYVEWRHSGEFELYDLKRDPWMLEDLDGKVAYESIESELARRLRAIRSCRGAGCSRPPRPAPATRAAVQGAADRTRAVEGPARGLLQGPAAARARPAGSVRAGAQGATRAGEGDGPFWPDRDPGPQDGLGQHPVNELPGRAAAELRPQLKHVIDQGETRGDLKVGGIQLAAVQDARRRSSRRSDRASRAARPGARPRARPSLPRAT